MSIQISENIIKGSIIYQLTQLFGDQYTYYGEEIPENFKRPCFHVSRISDISTKGYTGNEYRFRDDQYRYEIKYFTDKKTNINEDINDKIDILKNGFDYLNIININDGKIDSKPNRINSIEIQTSEDVLMFDLIFPIRVVLPQSVDKVQANILNEYLKETYNKNKGGR